MASPLRPMRSFHPSFHMLTLVPIGFDSSLMGSINALPKYIEYFGLPENGNASTGIVFAIFQVNQSLQQTLHEHD
jgi:hypothetical protein